MNYKLIVSCLLVTVAMYVQLPLLPMLLACAAPAYTPAQVAAVAAVPGIGVFALGCFSSYLVQHYRRNMVCIAALAALALCSYALFYLTVTVETASGLRLRLFASADGGAGWLVLLVVRFVQGAVFGLAQMVLSGTLVIDTCQSPRRSAANQVASWFARFALALGPVFAMALFRYREHFTAAVGVDAGGAGYVDAVGFAFRAAALVSAALCVVSATLVMSVKFPFKAPEDIVPHVSTDRFFLTQGKWLFVNLVLAVAAVGVLLFAECTVRFYAVLAFGLLLSLLAERTVLSSAGAGTVIQAGILLVFLSAVMLFLGGSVSAWGVPLLLGCGAGLSGARFLSLFITLSPHCRRATAQSTYFLSWELGLYCGVFIACLVKYGFDGSVAKFASVLSFASLLMFAVFTRKWYMAHKNR